MKNRTLEEIIRAEQSHRHEGGQFGINACKKSIRFSVEYLGENLADLLNEYVERANADAFFNKAMVLACWELMQEAETEAAETEATEEGKTMKNYIGRRGTEADNINAVIEAYEATRDGKTADTVNRIIEMVGAESAAVAIATTVNAVSLHDGRISDNNREWAQGVEGAPSNEELRALGIYGVDSWMHSAHVDNLANAWRRYERENPATEPETVEEEPTEEASADPSEIIAEASEAIKNNKSANRSAWGRGVTAYALELLEELAEAVRGGWVTLEELGASAGARKSAMLNGARDWSDYSWGGCSLIYNGDIAERLCTPSELKRTRGGEWRPNASEEWLDTQARALFQASNRASRALAEALKSRA